MRTGSDRKNARCRLTCLAHSDRSDSALSYFRGDLSDRLRRLLSSALSSFGEVIHEWSNFRRCCIDRFVRECSTRLSARFPTPAPARASTREDIAIPASGAYAEWTRCVMDTDVNVMSLATAKCRVVETSDGLGIDR